MNRRALLKTVTATGILAIAGCSSDGLGDGEQGGSGQENNNQNEEITPPGNPEAVGTIEASYPIAYQGKETSRDLLSTAITSFQDSDYGLVISTLDGFKSDVNGYGDTFSDIAETADGAGYDEVAASARAGESECTALANAGEALRDGAQLAQDGEQDEADMKIANAQSFIETADTERQDVLSPSEVSSRL